MSATYNSQHDATSVKEQKGVVHRVSFPLLELSAGSSLDVPPIDHVSLTQSLSRAA